MGGVGNCRAGGTLACSEKAAMDDDDSDAAAAAAVAESVVGVDLRQVLLLLIVRFGFRW